MKNAQGFRYSFLFTVSLVCAVLAAPLAFAQTSNSGAVIGTVTDQSGAVTPNAQVELVNVDTNAALTQTTDTSGGYRFPNVPPGNYRLTVKLAGFRASTLNLAVEVNKTATANMKLEVGSDTEVVEVSASGAAVQLQTTDSQIGNVLSTDQILKLPTLQRNATELMGLQPGTTAQGGSGAAPLAYRVSGGIDDQNLVTLDGIDITQSVVAGNTSVPTPADSVEEAKTNTSDPNAAFARASGGQMTLVGRHGSNNIHGAVYEYLQNSALNTNTWDNNRAKIPIASIRDNRFGARLGGPLKKNKTFLFGNYEGRRFSSVAQVTRTVPTATLKQGIVQFADPSGHVDQFNLANASVCGPSGNNPCDPRGLGISPAVAAQWGKMPLPNLPGGDGLNTGGYLANISTPIQTDYGVARLDHYFSDKVQFNGDYTYFRSIQTGSNDISIINGQPTSVISTPQRGQVISSQVTWQISPTLLNIFRAGYVRDTNASQATSPTIAAGLLNIPGTQTADGPVALLIGSGVGSFIDSPIDMDTQRARYQANYNGSWQWDDDMTKIWGKHTFQFGAAVYMLPYTHVRADKVVGSISSLVAQVDGDQNFLSIPSTDRPLTCSGSVTSNCLSSVNLTNWDRYYASVLGMVDNVNVLAVRDANLQPLPLGTPLVNRTNEWAPYFYGQDSWRISPSLTFTFGLAYGWQTAPTEQNNLQTVMINATNGQLIDAIPFLKTKEQAALAGQIYNPTIGYSPVKTARVPVYNVDYGDLSPRVSFAWNPSFQNGLFGKIFGDRKMVIRGGYALIYDRANTVQAVEIPMLGVGFDQTIIAGAPLCNSTGAGGAGCLASAGSSNPGLSAFRVGVDGALPLPTPSAATAPVIPSTLGEILSFQVDPNTKIGRSHNIDLSIQRELPGNMILELAYVGRFSRHLPQAVNIAADPYMFVDKASGQSFAQAYDAVANALRNGQTPTAQPFFENQFPGLAAAEKSNAASSTAYIVGKNGANFTQGNVSNLFLNLDSYSRKLGQTELTNDQAEMEFMRTYIGEANYNSGFVSLTKRLSHGLTFAGNYTYSIALDSDLGNQNNAGFFSNSFHPGVGYGPSTFDRTHTFNAYYNYELPAGTGHRFSTGTAFDKLLGGWYTSGIFTAFSGLPVLVNESSQVWGGGLLGLSFNAGMIPTASIPGTSVHSGVTPASGSAGSAGGGKTGTGLNLFADPQAVYNDFRYVQLSSDTRDGRANPLRGLPFWNLDARLGKDTHVTEKVTVGFSADFFNIFNHQNFATPTLNYTSPASFGVITSTQAPINRPNAARWIELGLRVDF